MSPGNFLHSDNPRVPRADYPYRHSLRIQARFTDIDMLGHVNNNSYLSYMDLGKADYFKAALGALFDFGNITVVIVNLNIDFFEQSFFTEPLEVWTRVKAVGTRSITLEQRVTNAATGHTKCLCTTVMASFDPATAKSSPLLPEWVEAVEAFEGRTFTRE